MSIDCTRSFRLSFISIAADQSVPPISEVLARIRSSPSWDVASICPADEQFPRVDVEWHEGHGFVIHCFEDDQSLGDFLVRGERMSSPTIEVNLGGQALERWPSELFVSEPVAHQALECFLISGRQDPGLHWVGIDGFPRQIVWESQDGRRPRTVN